MRPVPDVRVTAVHPRVLEINEPGEEAAWVLACWRDPGGAKALHAALRPRIEATLLAALSTPAGMLRERPVRQESLRLALFPEIDGAREAVRAFGLQKDAGDDATWQRALAHLRGEAQTLGTGAGDTPSSTWTARLARADGIDAVEARLCDATPDDEVWGADPGAPSRRLAAALASEGHPAFEPDLDGLRALEPVVVPQVRGPIRWIPPLVFQALCDLVCVVIERDCMKRPELAVCELDDDGLAPPPLFRLAQRGGAHVHVPLGEELLRWCVMPARPGEDIPPLARWVAATFG
jgi:hypothetical protein